MAPPRSRGRCFPLAAALSLRLSLLLSEGEGLGESVCEMHNGQLKPQSSAGGRARETALQLSEVCRADVRVREVLRRAIEGNPNRFIVLAWHFLSFYSTTTRPVKQTHISPSALSMSTSSPVLPAPSSTHPESPLAGAELLTYHTTISSLGCVPSVRLPAKYTKNIACRSSLPAPVLSAANPSWANL